MEVVHGVHDRCVYGNSRHVSSHQLPAVVLKGSGVFIPPDTITNLELVSAFNNFARVFNARNLSTGTKCIELSDPTFIEEASGIRRRHVIEKTGILDPSS